MLAQPSSPILVFQHIPKAAGTSVAELLRLLWPDGRVWPERFGVARSIHRARQRPWREAGFWDAPRVIAGHFPLGHDLIGSIGERPAIFAAVLRDPVARAVSSYDFIRRTKRHHLYPALSELSLLGALEGNAAFAAQMRCGQLHYLFGNAEMETARLALADRAFLLGRMDALPAFAAALARIAGWQGAPPEVPRRNTAGDKPQTLELAATQPDHGRALALLRDWNRVEIAFLRRIDPLLVSAGMRRKFSGICA